MFRLGADGPARSVGTMALVTCPDCGRQVSDAAPSCPGCGRPIGSHVVAPAQTAETVLLQDGAVTVSNTRVIVQPHTTYAMANITSVREFVDPKPVGVLLCGFLLLCSGFACVQVAEMGAGWVVTLMGAALVVWFLVMKPKHWVRIGTAGAEANALWSHDAQWIRRVVEAINSAMIARG